MVFILKLLVFHRYLMTIADAVLATAFGLMLLPNPTITTDSIIVAIPITTVV